MQQSHRITALALAASLLTCFAPDSARAGGVEYLTNQSADYIRTFSRNAARDNVDIVSFNPAATTWLGDGIHLSLSNQTVFGEYSATMNGEKFPADVFVPALPSLHFGYNSGNLAIFGAVVIPSGGGSLEYSKGIPYLQPLSLFVDGNDAGKPPENGTFSGSSLNYGVILGGAYKVLNTVSVSVGARLNYHVKSYTGEVTYGDTLAKLDANKTALGFTPIVGVTVRPGFGLTLAARYEFKTGMEFEADTTHQNLKDMSTWKGGPLESFATGAKEQRDMPAVLGLGLQWDGPLGLVLSTSFHYYFTEQADGSKDQDPKIKETGLGGYVKGWDDDYTNGWDLAFSAEYTLLKMVTVSVGYIHTVTGGNTDTYSDFEYALDSDSVGAGVRVRLTKLIGATLAVSRTFYRDGDGNLALPTKFDAPETETFSKSVSAVALGVQVNL